MNKLFGIAVAAALSMTSTYAWADRLNQLSDERVRQAIAYAIDMDTIVETLFEGKAIVADSMIPNGGFKAEGLEMYSYDPDRARALLAEANWDDSQVLDVVYYYGDQLTADLMVAMQAYLADVGIQMTYRKLEGDVGGQLNLLPESGSDTSAVTWDLAYGARAALALQEYYNGYQSGRSSYAPGLAERDELIARINGTVNVDEQKAAFALAPPPANARRIPSRLNARSLNLSSLRRTTAARSPGLPRSHRWAVPSPLEDTRVLLSGPKAIESTPCSCPRKTRD